MRKHTHELKLLPWRKIKARIIDHTGTVTEFAAMLGKSPGAIRGAAEGKCPKVLSRMQAILGSLAA